jgi:hypothetical protein
MTLIKKVLKQSNIAVQWGKLCLALACHICFENESIFRET